MENNTFIVIPAYNEEKSIGRVLKDLKDSGYNNLVVVDDGSHDFTSKIAEAHNAHLVRHSFNRGQGASLKTGIDYALQQGANILVTFDADGQFKVDEIKGMIEPVYNKEVDITLGSRFLGKTENIPKLKKLTLKGGILFTYLFSNIKLTDTHNGFKAISREAAQKMKISQDRMAHASEMIDEIKNKKLRYKEIPVTVIYTDYSKEKGQSIFNSLRIVFHLIIEKLSK